MTSLQFELLDEDDPAALLSFDWRHGKPDEVFLSVNCRHGTVRCFSRPYGVGWSRLVEQRVSLVWRVPVLTTSAANELMTRNSERFQQIVDGFTDASSGSAAFYDELATTAIAAVQVSCHASKWQEDSLVGWVTAADWVSTGGGLEAFLQQAGVTAQSTDNQLMRIVKQEEDRANAYGLCAATVLVGMYSLLERAREMKVDELAEALRVADEEVGRAVRNRDALMRQLAAAGKKSRDLGGPDGLTSMSHMSARARIAPRSVIDAAHALLDLGGVWIQEGDRLVYAAGEDLRLVLPVDGDGEVYYRAPTDDDPERILPTGIVCLDPRVDAVPVPALSAAEPRFVADASWDTDSIVVMCEATGHLELIGALEWVDPDDDSPAADDRRREAITRALAFLGWEPIPGEEWQHIEGGLDNESGAERVPVRKKS